MNWIEFAIWGSCALALLAANALFVAAEYALIRLRYSHFNDELLEKLKETPGIAPVIDRAENTVRLLRMGTTACPIGYGFLGFYVLTSTGVNGPLAGIVTFLVALSVFYVMGEMVPRGLALHYPTQAMASTSLLVRVWGWLVRQPVAFLNSISLALLRRFGITARADMEALSVEAQLDALGEEVPNMSAITARIIRNSLGIRKLEVGDVLLPRSELQWFDLEDGNAHNLQIARETGHTRFPLCEGSLDRCLGLIHIKDLFRAGGDPAQVDWRKMKRDILRVKPDLTLDVVLECLLREKAHMALVVDEFGGTEGVITLEMILEELVGQIQDEFDSEEARIKKLRDGEFLVSGLAPVFELEKELGVEFDNEEVATFGGLVTSELGRIPEKREVVLVGPVRAIITEVDGKRVIAGRVSVLTPGAPADSG